MSAKWADTAPWTPPTRVRGEDAAGRGARPPRPGSTRWLAAVTFAVALVPAADFLTP